MTTTRFELADWFDAGREAGATHMIVVVDEFSYEDHPVYVMPGEDFWAVHARNDGVEMRRVMEVYDLADPRDEQVHTVALMMRCPPRTSPNRGGL